MKISKITESLSEYNYNDMIRKMWDEKLSEAQKSFNISFDTENNDSVKKPTLLKINDAQFLVETMVGAGDWESPTLYYRIQVKEGFITNNNKVRHHDECFVFIPNDQEGNKALKADENGRLMPLDADENEDLEYNENECFASLKKYLESHLSNPKDLI